RIGLLRGKGVSSLNFGAIWHFFEQELHYPVTVLDSDYFKQIDFSGFDVLVVPSGFYYSLLDENTTNKLREWVQKGGKIIAFEYALRAFADKDGFGLKSNKSEDSESENQNLIPYAEREEASVKDFITGSIFKIAIDNTHPMAFGYGNTYHTLKANRASYAFLENGYNVGYIQGAAESVSGFVGSAALKQQSNSLIFGEQRLGRGSMVYFVDDLLFRSFWHNGKLFFVNSLFFVNNSVPVL
ncbi:MAG TPA: zinc carboxypeptidase, partial [Flavobacteriaceae bacterium]|nr:zinc carboxypeptidase [Flavobacteriaceae bacterium]